MKLCYVVTTPDVTATGATAYSGPLEPFFRKLHALGYQGVELMVRNPREVDLPYIRKILSENSLEVALVNTGRVFLDDGYSLMLPPGERREEARQRILALIDFAAAVARPAPFGPQINAGLLRGRVAPGQNPAEAHAWVVENLKYVADYAAQKGARIALEPINRYQSNFVNNGEQAVALIRQVGMSNVGIQMDVFHMNIEDASFREAFVSAKAYITYVHVADSNRLAPGWGHLPFDEVFAILYEIGYDGYLTAEILPKPEPDLAARQAAEFLRPRTEGLRR